MKTILITGGAGFIGSNASEYYLNKGDDVIILDNLSRAGAERNLVWLQSKFPQLKFEKVDIRDAEAVKAAFKKYPKIDVVLHLAAQVAVTTSVVNPVEDMQINVMGTFHVLEAIREFHPDAVVLYSSTNKVYGGMEQIEVHEVGGKYAYKDYVYGIPETETLDFHSPYGCSKGAADQYVRDYNRIYGLKTIVFRQSCIYGYRQFGVEDQGWVAWFTIATLLNKPMNIYGDGKQTRDVLFISDLINAYDSAVENIDITSGKIYNIGGGHQNQMSVLELVGHLEGYFKKKLNPNFAEWRPGDQKVFVADISRAKQEFGWEPQVSVPQGIEKLASWIHQNEELFQF